ncbi:MAG TPA: hypothetical protein VF588_04475 [Pyrinomonadaceae bacterium]
MSLQGPQADAVSVQEKPARAAPSPESKERRDERPEAAAPPEPATTRVQTTTAPAVKPDAAPASDNSLPAGPRKAPEEAPEPAKHFRWRAAVEQSLLFLSVQHGYALTQPKTRRDLSGNFLRDYIRSVRSLHGWADGGRFFTNYVAHPMQGSLLGFVQVQNDPAGSRLRFGDGGDYWRSRMKALAWSAAWSTQFEIGPVSQASIGNVGLHGKQTYVDLVMTPTAGFGLLVAEDALDRYVIERLERRSQNKYVRIFGRMALNPTRTAANLLRFKKPWYRDAGLR